MAILRSLTDKQYEHLQDFAKSHGMARIYRVKNNKPEWIGEAKWCTASCRGAISEVFQELVRMGELPKSTLKQSVSPCQEAGYYMRDNGKFKIHGVGIYS
jgi:hypothetical protein